MFAAHPDLLSPLLQCVHRVIATFLIKQSGLQRGQAHTGKELERLCRYITRPAIANERLKRNPAGQIVLQLKSPYPRPKAEPA